jgi:hypothetical protein
VIFRSIATDIVATPPAGLGLEVYLRDTCVDPVTVAPIGNCTAQSSLISQSPDGSGAPSGAGTGNTLGGYAATPGGRFVAFASGASFSSPFFTWSGGGVQVYERDTCGRPNAPISGCTPSTLLVSQNASGAFDPARSSNSPSVSADGRFVVFASLGANFPQSNGKEQVYLKDTCFSTASAVPLPGCDPTKTQPILLSVGTDGVSAANASVFTYPHSLSADGRFVIFASQATNLAANITPAAASIAAIYVRDTCQTSSGPVASCQPTTLAISLDGQGNALQPQYSQSDNGFWGLAISADGHYATFMYYDASHVLRVALAATGF